MKLTTFSERLFDRMMNADRDGAIVVIDDAFKLQMPPDQIIKEILDPALLEIGRLWGEQSVSMAQAFVGGKIAEDVLLRCIPSGENASKSPDKCAVVIGNIEDDYHSLGRRMVYSFLNVAGWDVYDLGNDVTAEQFVDKAVEVNAHIIGVSAMMQTTALNIRNVRILIDDHGLQNSIKLAVGGAVFNWRPELVAEVGGDGTASNAASVDGLFMQLLDEVKGKPAS